VLEDIEILEIAGYVPYGPEIVANLDDGRAQYGTATIVYVDDLPRGPGWMAQNGDYGMTRDEARSDAARRIARNIRL
jgi:hypothetical protein